MTPRKGRLISPSLLSRFHASFPADPLTGSRLATGLLRSVSVLSIVVALAWTPFQAGAQDDEEVPSLREVVVTATREEEEIRNIPAHVTVITREEIEEAKARSVADLLRSEEGIVVRDLLANGKSAQVDLRGFGETGPFNTLVLVDGRRVNSIDLSGVDWTQIPIDQIERIEIVRGTGTVVYGDNAVGGVINIITKAPSDEPTARAAVHAGSYEQNRGEASAGGRYGRFAASVSASYDSSDGYRDNSEFTARDVGGKILFDATEFLGLDLSGSYHSDDYGLPGALTEQEVAADRRATTNPADDGESTDQYLKLGANLDLGDRGKVIADFSYRDRESEGDFPDPLFPYAIRDDADTWAMTPRYIWDGDVAGHANKLITGVDFYWSGLDVKTLSGFFTPMAELSGLAEIDRDSLGLYVHDEFSLLENLLLSVGARRERVTYDLRQIDLSLFPLAPLDETVKDRENAYAIGLTYLYGDRSSVFARANRSFRFPLSDEIVIYDFPAGRIRVNSDLKPQTGHHYEVGIRHSFTPGAEARVTLFRAEIKDEIFFNPAPIFSNENHPQTLHQGVEIGSTVDLFEKVTLFGNYTYEKATFEKEPFKDNEIPAVPQHKANLGFRVRDLLPGFVFLVDYNYVGESYAISDQANRFKELDWYHTLDARLSYQWQRLKAFVGVNNIFDEEYSEYAVIGGTPAGLNLYPAPGRNVVAGVEAVF